ncbi:MAG: leucine-rich repeat protein [Mogibacterium sp.]|nr:leucine-rich repeat protein [Mogibacterium sp.]
MSIRIRKALLVAAVLGFVLAVFPAAASIAYADVSAPGKVETMTLKVTGQPSATVGWKRVDGAAGYKIYRNGQAIAKVTENEGITKDTLYYTDRTLTPGESFRYTVKAYVMDGETCVYGGAAPAQRSDNGYVYEEQDDGAMTLTGYTGREENLDVPVEIGGEPVTEIGDECYSGNVWITKVRVPEGITKIGDYGFEACSLMEKIYLPDSLKTIGAGAFSGCGQLSLVDIQDAVTSIGDGAFLYCTKLSAAPISDSLEELGQFAFAGCSSIMSADLKKTSLQELPDRVFCDCAKLSEITLPRGLKTIGKRAFFGCNKLTGLELPVGVEKIGDYAFEACPRLSVAYPGMSMDMGFAVFSMMRASFSTGEDRIGDLYPGMKPAEGSYAFSGFVGLFYDPEMEYPFCEITDGSLYTDDGKTLLAYFPCAQDSTAEKMVKTEEAEQGVFTVKQGVTRIAPYAFYDSELTSVSLPDTIREIPANAFAGSGLTRDDVVIPEGASVVIDENAFDPKKVSDTPDEPVDDPDEPVDDPDDPDDDFPDDYTIAEDVDIQSLTGDQSLYDPADYEGYLTLNDDDLFDAWLKKYTEYNKDTVPITREAMPYITMYTGEDHYRQMTSALNHDVFKTKRSIELSGDDSEQMYLRIDHGLFAELSRGKVPDDLILYSGITPERVSDIAGISRETMPTEEQLVAAVGSITQDQAMMSTTGSLSTAFAFGDYSKTVVFIYASQEALDELGTICVDDFSYFGGEHELLFNTDASYRVLEVGKAIRTYYVIDNVTGDKKQFGDPTEYHYVRLRLLTKSEAASEQMDGTEMLSEPEYTWADDHSSVTASVVCSDAGDVLTETAEAVFEVVKKPAVDAPGLGKFTAKFRNSCFETQVFEVDLNMTEEQIVAADALTEALIDIYENVDESLYKPASYAALQEQIDAAEAVLADWTLEAKTLRAAKTALLKARKSPVKRTSIAGAEVTGLAAKVFANKAYKPQPAVTLDGRTLTAGTDYKVSYQDNKNAGTAKVVVTGQGDYTGTAVGTFKIAKAAQKMTAKAVVKTVKAKKLKKAKKTVSGVIKVKKAAGKITYAKVSGSGKLSINKKTGKITVKKGTKKGTYKIKVKVKAAGNKNYKAKTVKVTVKIKVK